MAEDVMIFLGGAGAGCLLTAAWLSWLDTRGVRPNDSPLRPRDEQEG